MLVPGEDSTMSEPFARTDHPDMILADKKANLGDSELTVPTDGSVSDEGGYGGWFSEFRSIAKSTKDSFFPALDGIVTMVHRSAMAVAAEIAHLEHDVVAEMDTEQWRDESVGSNHKTEACELLPLPWEFIVDTNGSLVDDDGMYVVKYSANEELKQKIFELSSIDNTFLEPFPPDGSDAVDKPFPLNESRVQLIRRLLAVDVNLSRMHATITSKNLSARRYPTYASPSMFSDTVEISSDWHFAGRGDVKETMFWKNYFFHCNRVRLNFITSNPELQDVENDDSSALGSLIGAESVTSSQDDSSYVRVSSAVASPPTSLNTLSGIMSMGDMVLIGADGGDLDMSPERRRAN